MNAARSRPDWLATVQSGRKQTQSRVCTPGFSVHADEKAWRHMEGIMAYWCILRKITKVREKICRTLSPTHFSALEITIIINLIILNT